MWPDPAPHVPRFCPQVPFFLFVIFVVYTLLPFGMQGAVAAGAVSSLSHLLVLGVLTEVFSSPSVGVGLQVRGPGGLGGAWGSGCGQPGPWG